MLKDREKKPRISKNLENIKKPGKKHLKYQNIIRNVEKPGKKTTKIS